MRWKIVFLTLILSFITMGQLLFAKTMVDVKGVQITLEKEEIYYGKSDQLVPVAKILKAMGYDLEWNPEAGTTLISPIEMTIKTGSKEVNREDKQFILEEEVVISKGRMYVPLRFFASVLGYDVTYKGNKLSISGEENLGVEGKYDVEKRITISAAGDFVLGTYIGQGRGNRFDEVAKANGYTYFMKGVKEIFKEDDLTIVNLEGPLTYKGTGVKKEFTIKGIPDYVNILKDGDIEVVNLANNHTYDYGKAGYDDTKYLLRKNDIGYFGKEDTYYATVNGIRVAIIGESAWNNGNEIKNKLKKRIEEAKQKADLIIVEFHWGIERENYANVAQKDLAKYVIDQGAHLILGSHPHVIQGVGSYKNTNIVYSMGNFCFGANKNPADKDTFIYKETFVLTDEGIKSEAQEIIPCSISSVSNKNNYQPKVLTGSEKNRVLKRLAEYSKGLNER